MRKPVPRGASLVEIVIWIVIAAILIGYGVSKYDALIGRTDRAVVSQQAEQAQKALSMWVALQPSLAAASNRFKPGPSGDMVVAADDLPTLLAELKRVYTDLGDSFSADGDHVVSERMRAMGAYMTVTWSKPVRDNYPKMNLVLPD